MLPCQGQLASPQLGSMTNAPPMRRRQSHCKQLPARWRPPRSGGSGNTFGTAICAEPPWPVAHGERIQLYSCHALLPAGHRSVTSTGACHSLPHLCKPVTAYHTWMLMLLVPAGVRAVMPSIVVPAAAKLPGKVPDGTCVPQAAGTSRIA